MKLMKATVLALALFFATGAAVQLCAIEKEMEPTYVENMTRKLGRGISNVAFGALEVPIQIYEVQFDHGGIAALTWGTLSGVVYFIERELVGVAEIITFPVPLPGCRFDPRESGWGFGPIVRPEWIITPETNVYNVVYPTKKTMSGM